MTLLVMGDFFVQISYTKHFVDLTRNIHILNFV